ncbi:MAG: prephenate dehydrogenase/arogenate dehydrogenase family protein [candidate division Zixibacteria bacterium]
MKSKLIIIGFGKMGKHYAKLFSNAFEVGVISTCNIREEVEQTGARLIDNFETAISSADYLLLSVPINALGNVITKINKYVRPDTIAIDVCSARVAAEKELSRLKCKHFGLHGDIVIGTPDEKIIDFLSRGNNEFIYMSPEEHDKHNSIYGLVHFIGLALDDFLTEENKSALAKSPAGMFILNLVAHIKDNSPATYWETQMLNMITGEKRKEFIKALQNYDKLLGEGKSPFEFFVNDCVTTNDNE